MTDQPQLTQAGKPRKRAPGGGRPSKHGEATRSLRLRVPLSVTTGHISAIPELMALVDHWEDECAANPEPDGARYYYARKMVDELRALGY